MSTMSYNVSNQTNENNINIIDNQKRSHCSSKSIDIVSLNKTFSELNVQSNEKHEESFPELKVQSNEKHEKTSIEKINEIILGSEKYFIPEKPVLKVNTKTSSKKGIRTPVSEVNFNELLKSLDDLTSEVNNNKEHKQKENGEKAKNNISDRKLSHSASFKNLFNIGKKLSNESLKNNEEKNSFTDIIQNSKNYLLNLASKTVTGNQENIEKSEENNEKINKNKEVEENKENKEINENKDINENKKISKNEKIEIPNIRIVVNSRKSSESTICKPENEQFESTIREDLEIDEENDSIINNSGINLYSKNRGSINLDTYMNSEAFPNTPITPISPEQKVSELLVKDEEIKEDDKEDEEKAFEEQETLILQSEPPKFIYEHRKSNSEIMVPAKKAKSSMRHTCSKDKLESLKNENIEPSLEGYASYSNVEGQESQEETESNPIRNDSIRYSHCHTLNNNESRRKTLLNQKIKTSINLHKKISQNRLSLNRSSINFQDIQNVKDLSNVTNSFNVNNRNLNSSNNENGKNDYYIKQLKVEDTNNNDMMEDIDNQSKFGTFGGSNNAATIKLYRNTRKLSDVTSNHQRSSSLESYHSLPVMNNNSPNYRYDKIIISPSLMAKKSPNIISKNSPSLISRNSPNLIAMSSPSSIAKKSPSLINKNSPENKSSLSNQSYNANDKELENGNNGKLSVPTVIDENNDNKLDMSSMDERNRRKSNVSCIHEEDNLGLLTSDIEKDKSIEKMMDSLEAIKSNIDGKNKEDEENKEENNTIKPSWAKNNNHSSLSSINTQDTKDEKNEKEKDDDAENHIYVASPERKQYQSGIVFSKRNSSLTRFSVAGARSRNSVAPEVGIKSKYYRYSVARNLNTYSNSTGRVPIPSHHTKLTIPHFNPSNAPKKPIINDNIENNSMLIEDLSNTNKIDSMIYSNGNTNKSFLFRDIRDNKNHKISNIKSEIEDIEEETSEDLIDEPELNFSFKSKDSFPLSKSMPSNMSNIMQEATLEDDIHSNMKNSLSLFRTKKDNNNNNNNINMHNTLPSSFRTDKREYNKVNVNNIPFIYNKDQAQWETNMHTMSLYDEENPKPKKKKNFKKTFSIFKKRN